MNGHNGGGFIRNNENKILKNITGTTTGTGSGNSIMSKIFGGGGGTIEEVPEAASVSVPAVVVSPGSGGKQSLSKLFGRFYNFICVVVICLYVVIVILVCIYMYEYKCGYLYCVL